MTCGFRWKSRGQPGLRWGQRGDTALRVRLGRRRPRSVGAVFTRLLDSGRPGTHPSAELAADDVAAAVAAERRDAPPDRPWVMTNMVSSLDGAIATDSGVSGELGGPADGRMFSALRRRAEAIVAGAGTARAERYRPVSDALLVIVSGRGVLDPDLPMFGDPDHRPLVVLGAEADPNAVARWSDHAEIVRAEHARVAPADVLAELHRRDIGVVLVEGGPTLNAQWIAADLVDEWNLTLSPALVGGEAGRASVGPSGPGHRFVLDRLWTSDDQLFCRYLRP